MGTKAPILQTIRDVTAGALSGGIPVVLFYPVDLVRTQLQVQHLLLSSERRSSAYRTSVRIFRESGLRGFYRGLSTNLVGSCLAWGAYFSVFHRLQREMSVWSGDFDDCAAADQQDKAADEEVRAGRQHNHHRATIGPGLNLLCGFAAGAVSATLTTPIWIVKTRIQVGDLQGTLQSYPGLLRGLQSIVKTEGWMGLTRGMMPALLGTSHTALQFTVYEELIKRADSNQSDQVMACGAVSKLVASTVTNPLHVLKARMQIQSPGTQTAEMTPFSRSFLLAAKDAYRHEGIAGFYRGWLLTLIRTVPSSSLSFVIFEAISSALR